MERVNLEIQLREEKGKQLVKRLRAAGFVPAVVYKGGGDNVSLKVNEREFIRLIGAKAERHKKRKQDRVSKNLSMSWMGRSRRVSVRKNIAWARMIRCTLNQMSRTM